MDLNKLTHKVIGLAIEVHSKLGPGLLENVYKECLFYKLQKESLFTEKERPLPVIFEDVQLDCGYRIDLLVEKEIVLELKSVKKIEDIHIAQILTYLKLGKYKVGLLINFNVASLKYGIKRLIN